MKKILTATLLLLLTACDGDTKEQAKQKTLSSFSNPSLVGQLPDGRKIMAVTRFFEGVNFKHTIYFVDSTVTVNHTEHHGKTSANHVEVLIDGVSYKPAESFEK